MNKHAHLKYKNQQQQQKVDLKRTFMHNIFLLQH
jgi:hypothetical protein